MVQSAVLPPLVRGQWYPMSWEEFLDWAPGEGKSERVAGEGIAYVSNSVLHVRRVKFLATLLDMYVRAFDLGEVFSENMLLRLPSRPSGREPDIFVLGRAGLDRVYEQWTDAVPLLATEFLSDDSVFRDLVEKRHEFERAGIPEYRVFDSRAGQSEFVYLRLDDEGHYQEVEPDEQGRYHSVVLPGFWIDPTWFWQDPLPNPMVILRRISFEAWRHLVAEVEAEGV
jgi:Uma2 family endonuclease